jgi:ATP-dependent DNA helicase PIF1
MVDGALFDKLNRVGQKLRKKLQPFGGIQVRGLARFYMDLPIMLSAKQLVVTGDFFQLPPVNKGGEPNFVFEAETWEESIHKSINLTKVFRQRDESTCRLYQFSNTSWLIRNVSR